KASLTGHGIEIIGTGNVIDGNYLGTDVSGGVLIGNDGAGVLISGDNNTIGGTTPAARNVIAGNSEGLYLESHTTVVGNYIGTNAGGTAALANFDGLIVTGQGNTIGGTTVSARNLISGNGTGIYFAFGNHNLVMGNFIGTDATGRLALGNGDGINA